jgi:hypothetical protein
MTARLHASSIGAVLLTAVVVAQDSRPAPSGVEGPLPDKQVLFTATRDNLARAEREQRFFAYKERRTEVRTNPFGRLGTGPIRVYDVTPLPEGGFTRRLLERDGKPVPDAEIERFDPRNRGGRRPSGRSQLDDAIATLDFTVDRRESAGGRSLIVVKFSPRADAKPETRAGRLARSFIGDIWVDEELHEIVRVESTAIDDIAYGYGVVARLNAGTRVSVARRQIEPNLWLPVSLRFNGQGRALLFRKLTLDYAVDWFDYRRIAR